MLFNTAIAEFSNVVTRQVLHPMDTGLERPAYTRIGATRLTQMIGSVSKRIMAGMEKAVAAGMTKAGGSNKVVAAVYDRRRDHAGRSGHFLSLPAVIGPVPDWHYRYNAPAPIVYGLIELLPPPVVATWIAAR